MFTMRSGQRWTNSSDKMERNPARTMRSTRYSVSFFREGGLKRRLVHALAGYGKAGDTVVSPVPGRRLCAGEDHHDLPVGDGAGLLGP